jgi:hypothetical protein
MKTPDNLGAGRDDTSGRTAGAMAEASPTSIQDRFRDCFRDASYYSTGRDWNDYAPAYRYGVQAFARYRGKRFEDIERRLEQGWNSAKASSRLVWVEARGAVLDAWRQASDEALAGLAAERASRY